MTITDATTFIIQRILSSQGSAGQGSSGGSGQYTVVTWIAQETPLVGTAANYAQILGTPAGAIAQAAVASTLKSTAVQQAAGTLTAGTAAEAQQLAQAAAAGVAGVVTLMFSFFLAGVADSSGGSSESQQIEQLAEAVQQLRQDYIDVGLGDHWEHMFDLLLATWSSPPGSIGTDLDNLANEGIIGIDVKKDVSSFHDHGLAFVNILLPERTPGGAAEIFWERPIISGQQFDALPDVPYPIPISGTTYGWYGTYPQPAFGPPVGGSSSQMAVDPKSMLPFLLIGIQAYLTVEMLVNLSL